MVVSSFVLGLALVLYMGVFAFLVYICLIADSETSKVARYFTEQLPQALWTWLEERLSRRTIDTVAFFSDRVLLLVYCAVVYGAWSLIFWLVYPWIDQSPTVSNTHKIVGYVVFAACVSSWRFATSTSPGIITAKSISRYKHFPYDNLLFDDKRTCKTTGLPRLARSKFDRHKYNANVPRFDHFCGWVHNTIGEENYRYFLLFLLVHFGMCAYGSTVLWWLFVGEVREKKLLEAVYVDRITGEQVPASIFIAIQYLFNRFFYEGGVFMLTLVMAVALFLFLIYHAYLTSYGMTTNESYKWSYVRKWHKRELKRYNEAVKNGTIQEKNPQQQQQQPSSGEQANEPKESVRHPGPPPINIYDRGFVENWKEVLYPISLRQVPPVVSTSKTKKTK